ncbi:MAG: hypothetical protein J0L75_05115 [Spirochaetes bacterium]|nr:hypothetical protein [Spirochaetota bacterium]
MTKNCLVMLAYGVLLGAPIAGASISYSFTCRTKVIRGNDVFYENRAHPYVFRVEVCGDSGVAKAEGAKWGKPFIEAVPGERYCVRLHNPLPVRAAANLVIDGLSSVSGEPVAPEGGSKWILEGNTELTLRGWQVSGKEARRFVFTERGESYAAWRSGAWGRDLSVNCGVIAAAFFWSKGDLEAWFEDHPIVERGHEAHLSREKAPAVPGCRSSADSAGTGMGGRESHPVQTVAFHYDSGMYLARQAVVLYYDFAPVRERPTPFLERWAVEMPMGRDR